MPYTVRKKGDEWCVYNTDSDEEKACHETEEAADRQIKLLNGIEHGMVPRQEGQTSE
jgi:hypothetical protein